MLLGRELFDALDAAWHSPAGLRAQAGLLHTEELVGGDLEGLGDADDHLGGDADAVALVIGDEDVDGPDALGELLLGDAALLAQPGDRLPERLVFAEGDGRQVEAMRGANVNTASLCGTRELLTSERTRAKP